MSKTRSRPQRWADAVARAELASDALREAMNDLKEVQDEYQEWYDNLPENLQSSPVAEKLEEICQLDLEFENIEILDEASAVDLPLGFGRD